MRQRAWCVVACGALALQLAAAEASPAQVRVPGGPGGVVFGPVVGNPVGSNYLNSYYRPFVYDPPPAGYSSYALYGANAPTPPGYSGALPYYAGSAYQPAYSAAGAGTSAYATPGYPIQSPDYTTVFPAVTAAGNVARLEVRLPPDARLRFDGQPTAQTGAIRRFHTPPLEPAEEYYYDIRAQWNVDGKPVDATRRVTVHAGDRVVVDLNQQSAGK